MKSVCRILPHLVLWGALSVAAVAQQPRGLDYFEPVGADHYIARTSSGSILIDSNQLTLSLGDSSEATIEWTGARGDLQAIAPTGGVTNYILGQDPANWRTGVPHFQRVRSRNLYQGITAEYYFAGGRLEFDLVIDARADTASPQLKFSGVGSRTITQDGSLVIRAGEREYAFRRPEAYQIVSGVRTAIDCSYLRDPDGSIRFQLGAHDPAFSLVIDPVIDFMTYYGGDRSDHLTAIDVDPAGNVIVAGVTNSANLAGISQPANSTSAFVTKINSIGSAVVFTTVLGSRFGEPSSNQGWITSIDVDAEGNTFVTGFNSAPNFPVTPNAWQKSGGAFVTKLTPGGLIEYSTYLSPAVWGFVPAVIRARNGIAHVAGSFNAAEFLGTPGAYQRGLAGNTDLFAAALNADGSALLFATGFGGSGRETFSDMALDGAGNIALIGASQSADLPVTSNVVPPPGTNQSQGFLARLDANGSRLLYAGWTGAAFPNGLVSTPDGALVVAGSGVLPANLVGDAPHTVIQFPTNSPKNFAMKWSPGDRVLWATEIPGSAFAFGRGVAADTSGDLYFSDPPVWPGGGALSTIATLQGIQKLSADGTRLLYATGVPSAFLPNNSLRVATGPEGIVWAAGWTSASNWPSTPGSLQPARDPAPAGTTQAPLNSDDGLIIRLNLRNFRDGNFFAPAQAPVSVTWRVGEVLPEPVRIPLLYSGTPPAVQAVIDPAGLAALLQPDSSGIQVNADPSIATAGVVRGTLTLRALSIPDSDLVIPTTLTVLPTVSFEAAQSQVEIHARVGQVRDQLHIPITTNFGSEFFSINAESSDRSWLYPSVYNNDLTISTGDKPIGTYTATITLQLVGVQVASVRRTVSVRYIVEPPASLQVSTTFIQLHVIRNQPVQPVKVQVTSTPSNVPFSKFVGVSRTWLHVTQTGDRTPGEIQITADSAATESGLYSFAMFVSAEASPQIQITIQVDVSSAGQFDVVPREIRYTYDRKTDPSNNPIQFPQFISVTNPTPQAMQWSIDQPWVSPRSGSGTTPVPIYFSFDTSLPEGIRTATLTIRSGQTTLTVPITFELYDPVHLIYSSAPLSFRYQIGGPLPPTQTVRITTNQLRRGDFYAGLRTLPTFAKVDPPYGSTPQTLTISVDPSKLSPGTYRDEVGINPYYYAVPPAPNIPVILEVLADPNAPSASIDRVTNVASYLPGVVSPGEIVVLFGQGLGPETLVEARPSPEGVFPTSLSGTTVYFDNTPAPLIYTSATLVAGVAPFAIDGRTQVPVTVETGGRRSPPITLSVARTNPGIFTSNASGSGIAAAFNVASNGDMTLNTVNNPADKGGIVAFYVTGLGALVPTPADGAAVKAPVPTLRESVRVLVGGRDAEVLYAGPVPGYIAGLMQVNVRLPATVSSGPQPLLLSAAENVSQPGVTLVIR